MKVATTELPAAWHALPKHLQKPWWTVNEIIEGTGLSRATINREWATPGSRFPRRQRAGQRRVHVRALDVIAYMEG